LRQRPLQRLRWGALPTQVSGGPRQRIALAWLKDMLDSVLNPPTFSLEGLSGAAAPLTFVILVPRATD